MNKKTRRLLSLLLGGGRYKTLSGEPPLTFKSDGAELKSYRIYGAAGGVGDYDENSGKYVIPVTVSGKNLLNHIVTDKVSDKTLSVVVNNDKSITVNGVSDKALSVNIIQDFVPKEKEGATYILSGCPSGGSYSSYTMDMLNDNGIIRADSGKGTYFTADDRIGTLRIRIRIADNYPCNNLVFYPMIRLTNAGDSAYEPYTEPTTINIFLDEPVYEGESVSMADTDVQFGTIDGTNILTVGTTVQPSAVEIRGRIITVQTALNMAALSPVSMSMPDGFALMSESEEVVNYADNQGGYQTGEEADS